MASLLDLFQPTDVDNPGSTVMSPYVAGLAGAAAGMAPYLGTSRLPISNAQLLAGAAGGFGQGYSQGLRNIQQGQSNALTAAQLGFYRNMLPALGGLLNGSGPVQGNGSPANPQGAGAQTIPMAFRNGGQPVSASAPTPTPGGSVSSPVARAQQIALLGGLLNMKGLTDYAKMSLDYDPTVQAQLAAAKADPASPLAVDLRQEQAATANRDQQSADMWHIKALTDSGQLNVARNSGISQMIGGNGVPRWYLDPQRGVFMSNGHEELIPGATGVIGQTAFTRSGGESAGELLNKLVTTEIPSGPNAGQQQTMLGGQLFPITVPGVGTIGGGRGGASAPIAAPRTPVSAAPLAAPAAARSSAAAPAGVTTAISPAAENMSKAAGDLAGKNNEGYQTEAEVAKDQNTQIAAIRNSATTFAPGKFANVRGEFLNYLNSTPGGDVFAKAAFGDNWQQQLGSYQEGTKIGIQLQAGATRVLGAREAAQIFNWMGKSMPNLTMSGDGLDKVGSYMQGMNDYKIARAQMAQERFNQQDVVGVNNIRNEFIKNSDPTFFIMNDMSPADRVEFLKNMGKDKATQFVTAWKKAAEAGYAPHLGQ